MIIKLQVYNFETKRLEFMDSYYPDGVLVNEAAKAIMADRMLNKNWRL